MQGEEIAGDIDVVDTSAPIVSDQAWYGWSGEYLGVDGCCSNALLVGNATITLSSAPEPSTGAFMMLALGAALFRFKSRDGEPSL